METRSAQARFAGCRISYRVAGQGPVVVLVKNDIPPQVLADRYRVIQIDPLGFGSSDRPKDYPTAGLHRQVITVLDQEQVDRFLVWGYSQGAAMATAVAQAAPRVAGLVAGGSSLIDRHSDAQLRRMERTVPVAPMTFWHWYRRFDWLEELGAMQFPKLVYFGSGDGRRAARIRHTRKVLIERGVTVIEFDGLDHNTSRVEPSLSARVLPAVLDWINKKVGTSW